MCSPCCFLGTSPAMGWLWLWPGHAACLGVAAWPGAVAPVGTLRLQGGVGTGWEQGPDPLRGCASALPWALQLVRPSLGGLMA